MLLRPRPYAGKGPPTILLGRRILNSCSQTMQNMYWFPIWEAPVRAATWTFCFTLQCGHSMVVTTKRDSSAMRFLESVRCGSTGFYWAIWRDSSKAFQDGNQISTGCGFGHESMCPHPKRVRNGWSVVDC